MSFESMCVKGRWWFLIIGILTLSIYVGIVLVIFGIIGFAKNKKTYQIDYTLPQGFEYPKEVQKDQWIKCPVCKKGKVESDIKKKNIFRCDVCKTSFKEVEKDIFKISMKEADSKFSEYKYSNNTFSIYEWNHITLFDKTLKEQKLEEFREGKLPKAKLEGYSGILKSDETPVWAENSVSLSEPRAIRRYVGASGGRGLRIHMGQAESHPEMRVICSGSLILTNKRILFQSNLRSSNIDLKKIIGITSYSDGFLVNIENRVKPEFFAVSDVDFWTSLLSGTMLHIKK